MYFTLPLSLCLLSFPPYSPERSSMIIKTGNASGCHSTGTHQELRASRTSTTNSIKRKVPSTVPPCLSTSWCQSSVSPCHHIFPSETLLYRISLQIRKTTSVYTVLVKYVSKFYNYKLKKWFSLVTMAVLKRKGKDHCRVYCVAAHYGSFSVIKRCLCKRWKPPPHLTLDWPQQWTRKLCSLFYSIQMFCRRLGKQIWLFGIVTSLLSSVL